ncbi:MAG: hypothetical protein INF43_02145 [Alphaproteobacteria bacterium]|nr:hypothetical protein [Alphaproteobacteria bacterium]
MATHTALLGVAVLLAGCSSLLGPFAGSYRFKQQSAAQGCPPSAVERITQTRARLNLLQPGVTPAKELKFLGKPIRTMVLARAGQEDLLVNFYPLGVESCGWVADSPNYLPVVTQHRRGGVLLGYGMETLMTLHAQGWELGTRRTTARGLWRQGSAGEFTPTPWPWQSYGYRYLPRR